MVVQEAVALEIILQEALEHQERVIMEELGLTAVVRMVAVAAAVLVQ